MKQNSLSWVKNYWWEVPGDSDFYLKKFPENTMKEELALSSR